MVSPGRKPRDSRVQKNPKPRSGDRCLSTRTLVGVAAENLSPLWGLILLVAFNPGAHALGYTSVVALRLGRARRLRARVDGNEQGRDVSRPYKAETKRGQVYSDQKVPQSART